MIQKNIHKISFKSQLECCQLHILNQQNKIKRNFSHCIFRQSNFEKNSTGDQQKQIYQFNKQEYHILKQKLKNQRKSIQNLHFKNDKKLLNSENHTQLNKKQIQQQFHYEQQSNIVKNLFKKDRKTKNDHGIIICGHRGGSNKSEPENTLRAFEYAINNGVKIIEFDVWLTRDNKLVVIHGGNNGEIPHALNTQDQNIQYIFNHTFEYVQENHKKTAYFLEHPSKQDSKSLLPLLSEVFELVKQFNLQQRGISMNIELKCPYDPEVKKNYRFQDANKIINDMIYQYGLEHFSIIQSFDHELLDSFEQINKKYVFSQNQKLPICTLYLENYWHHEPIIKQVKKDDHCQGIHVQINWVNKMLVDELHQNDKIVAVWVDSSVDIYQENDDFYRKIYDLGVDMLTTDYPHRAQQVIHEHHIKSIFYQ